MKVRLYECRHSDVLFVLAVIARDEFMQAMTHAGTATSADPAGPLVDVIYPPGHEAEMAERMRQRINVSKKKLGPPPSNPAR